MWRDAVNIFAFDALIQNPDRRSANPNLFTQGDNIYVYDHETSFSFLVAVVKSAEPWNLEAEQYLTPFSIEGSNPRRLIWATSKND
jgi:hypothetical protein